MESEEYFSEGEESYEIEEIPEDDFEERFDKAYQIYERLKNYCDFHSLNLLNSKNTFILRVMDVL